MKVSLPKQYAENRDLVIPENENRLNGFVRNSYLSSVKRALSHSPQFWGDEDYLTFGSELHKREFEPRVKRLKLTKDEESRMKQMQLALAACKSYQAKKKISIKEQVRWVIINGVLIRGTLDQLVPGVFIDDLKSTTCKTYQAFIEASRKYDYFRQAWVYMQMEKVKEFGFTGIQKKEPFSIFEFLVQDYPDYIREGKEQAIILTDAVKQLKLIAPEKQAAKIAELKKQFNVRNLNFKIAA